jgi:hypothetical protein
MTPEELEERIRQLEESVKHLSSTEREAMDEELRDLERQVGLRNDQGQDDEEPDAPVPAPPLPRTPVLVGGNAQRLEETVEESEP